MKQPFFLNVLFVAFALGSLHLYDTYHEGHLTVERAMAPMQHLSNARHLIISSDYHGSIKEIDYAIMAMRIIEHGVDSVAAEHLETAIADLKLVEIEIRDDSVVVADLNKAFFNALNSIAYANLTISEESLENGEKYKAMSLMNASFAEMIRSLRFASSEKSIELENKAIEDIKTVLQKLKDSDYTYQFSFDSLNREIEELIE